MIGLGLLQVTIKDSSQTLRAFICWLFIFAASNTLPWTSKYHSINSFVSQFTQSDYWSWIDAWVQKVTNLNL